MSRIVDSLSCRFAISAFKALNPRPAVAGETDTRVENLSATNLEIIGAFALDPGPYAGYCSNILTLIHKWKFGGRDTGAQ